MSVGSSNKRIKQHTLVAAWTVLLLGSVLPRIVLEEAFSQAVTRDAQAIISLSVICIALLVTVVWKPLRVLRPFLVVFLVLVGGHWFVHGRIDQLLPSYRAWLRDPSFNVYMLAEQSLNVILTLVMIATLLLLGEASPGLLPAARRHRRSSRTCALARHQGRHALERAGRLADALHQPGHAGLPGHHRAPLAGHGHAAPAVLAGDSARGCA